MNEDLEGGMHVSLDFSIQIQINIKRGFCLCLCFNKGRSIIFGCLSFENIYNEI